VLPCKARSEVRRKEWTRTRKVFVRNMEKILRKQASKQASLTSAASVAASR
jgi:hypothetical protein